MARSILRALAAVAMLVAATPAARADAGYLTCESIGYKYGYCNANTQGRVIMVRKLSTGNLCQQGRGWGYDGNGIWVDRGGRVYLRNEVGAVASQGDLRDGLIYWNNGKRSWFAREGPGVALGDVDTGKHYYFRRNA
ncbi:MAG: DUF3011 domain-containing protein [Burkholderiales bacterium]